MQTCDIGIVGAGPGGIASAMWAKERSLSLYTAVKDAVRAADPIATHITK